MYKNNNNKFHTKKSFGQNFLYDEDILNDIISFANVSKDDFVLEIGPGKGTLTKLLSNNCKKILPIELDNDLISFLNSTFVNTNVTILHKDFLKTTDEELLDIFKSMSYQNENIKVVANIPYNITSLIINKLLSSKLINEITLLVQKEVADRICAKDDTHDYGILTLAVKYYADAIPGFIVDKKYFRPIPKVDSKVIKIVKHPVAFDEDFTKKFFKTIKAAFSKRRKTLANSLSSSSANITKEQIEDCLSKLNINTMARPEDLSIDNYFSLTKMLYP